MLNNLDLVEHVRKAYDEQWGYVWGTFGDVLTPTLLKQKAAQYPTEVGSKEGYIHNRYLGKRVADCVGLIKSYLWWDGKNPRYDRSTDVSADMMYNLSKTKGELFNHSLPSTIGILLWKKGHIGVYIGSGMVIEARGTNSGVILSGAHGTGSAGWTHWLECPFIRYFQPGEIKNLQVKLNLLGAGLVVDGIWGPKTRQALTHFQIGNNLYPHGTITDETLNRIDNMIERMTPVKHKDYVQLINEVSEGRAEDWVVAINTAVAVAKADGNLGELEILKYLPELIEKIGNPKKTTS
jgi:hypothetical protein